MIVRLFSCSSPWGLRFCAFSAWSPVLSSDTLMALTRCQPLGSHKYLNGKKMVKGKKGTR